MINLPFCIRETCVAGAAVPKTAVTAATVESPRLVQPMIRQRRMR